MSSIESDQQQEFARLRDLCAGDGEQLDLLEAAFSLSTLRRTEPLDLAPFRQHVAAMSDEVADLVRRRGATPDLLSEVISRSYAYRGDSETYDDLQNADLARVIERRKGLPVALAILYLHIARSQGWSATGLAFPGHFLIRIGMDGAQHVVDPFNEGSIRDAADLRKLLRQVAGSEADLAIATEALSLDPLLVTLPCYRWNRCVIAPPKHPLAKEKVLSIEALSKYPLITYDTAFTGRSQVDRAFASAGFAPNVALTALDSDVIKTYVRLNVGVGILAEMAYEPKVDADLKRMDASHLFAPSITRVGLRRNAFLRRFAYDFIVMFAPSLKRTEIEEAVFAKA